MEVFKANHLPEYIIQSFLMSGFDDMTVVCMPLLSPQLYQMV